MESSGQGVHPTSTGSPHPQSPAKHRLGAAQLLKKFIKMSSSTETQSQKCHGGGEGVRDTAVTSQTAEIRKRHTHTRQLQWETDNERKKGNPTPKSSPEGPTGRDRDPRAGCGDIGRAGRQGGGC